MNDDINEFVPSLLNPRTARKLSGDLSLTQHSIVSRCSLSLKRNNGLSKTPAKKKSENKENCQNSINKTPKPVRKCTSTSKDATTEVRPQGSIGYSAIEDIASGIDSRNIPSSPSFVEFLPANKIQLNTQGNREQFPVLSNSSHTELTDTLNNSSDTVIYNFHTEIPVISLSFGIKNCQNVDVSTKNINIKNFSVTHNETDLSVDCEIVEASDSASSTDSEPDENMNEKSFNNPLKRSAVAVNLKIKKKKGCDDADEKNKVLILNTDAIDKVSHVIVQPPNCNLVKKQITDKNTFRCKAYRKRSSVKDASKTKSSDSLIQKSIDCYFQKKPNASRVSDIGLLYNASVDNCQVRSHEGEMNRYLGVNDTTKFDRVTRTSFNSSKRDTGSARLKPLSSRENGLSSHLSSPTSLRRSADDTKRPRSPRSSLNSVKKHDEIRRTATATDESGKGPPGKNPAKKVPHFKIVAGTHFAVDAFSYGDIPNVKHYFLTHFHSDHYSGLKKSFNKMLFCSKITGDLCVARLGVNPKYIHIMNVEDTKTIDGVEVTAVDANHCPGALMLVFTLPNGKTILHTGDFRAVPAMESYPVLWNKDIHTLYLDTTYCNPRYDFPTQEESLEMALYMLRQKKVALEKVDKKFSSVLIVCGTYTIGKEKFFLGLARRIGCTVWACPEKDKVLQIVEGKSFSKDGPDTCQLHVVPMRDLTVDKLLGYLTSLGGAFDEVVAFKPSGWENGKNSIVEVDRVTIYGIPYSEHSSFSEMIRFVKFLKPKQVVPTVDISGGIKAVQKYFPCPLVYLEESHNQSRVTEYFRAQNQPPPSANVR